MDLARRQSPSDFNLCYQLCQSSDPPPSPLARWPSRGQLGTKPRMGREGGVGWRGLEGQFMTPLALSWAKRGTGSYNLQPPSL